MDKNNEQWAVFWCDLLRPILYSEISPEEMNGYLRTLAQQAVVYPDGKSGTPSLSTLKRKLDAYQSGGFDALGRKARSDRGQGRSISVEIIDAAVTMKKEQPLRSDITINRLLEERFGVSIPRSSLYRYLKAAGATRLKLGVTVKPVRKRWGRDNAHELWVGDFEEGPYVSNGPDAVPTCLSAFIDCHSRYIVAGRYYFRQNLDVLIDTLLRALAAHGMPLGLYVDNAKVYHSNGLKAACYRLNIQLLHRKKGDPAGGGVIERFFRTTQERFESEVRAGEILTLDSLNQAFAAWLAQDYHKSRHSEIETTPEKALEQGRSVIRQVDLNAFSKSFMQVAKRTVSPVFSDIQLNKRYYKTDPGLRGDRIEVRYDPFSTQDTVELYSLKNVYLGQGYFHQRTEAEPIVPSLPEKPKSNYLALLQRRHQQDLAAKTQGIDYRKAVEHRPWPFHEFARLIADLLGRKGGLGSFNSQELEVLKKTWNMHATINTTMVRQACAAAPVKTIPHVIRELKTLFCRGE